MKGAEGVYLRGGGWGRAYSHRGDVYRRSSGSPSRTVAERMRREALKKLGSGYNPDEERLSFGQMLERVRLDRQKHQRRCHALDQRAAHLRPFFGDLRASEINTEAVDRYVTLRLEDGAQAATVNRELALLRRAFSVSEISRKPRITLLPENNARRDFLDWADFIRVREHLAPAFRDFFSFLYLSSWRQGQVAAL